MTEVNNITFFESFLMMGPNDLILLIEESLISTLLEFPIIFMNEPLAILFLTFKLLITIIRWVSPELNNINDPVSPSPKHLIFSAVRLLIEILLYKK